MKAMIIKQFGSNDVFEEAEIQKPAITAGHVLIRVKATSVNPFDCKLRLGKYANLVTSFPAVLHGDVAGIIEEVGEKVSDFSIGDEVYGCVGGILNMGGGLAEYVLADAKLIAKKPRSLSFLEASALPLVSLTAWEALISYANLKPGQTLLVHGGCGGVGQLAIQLAKHLDATVYTTVSSTEKAEIAKKLGADFTINYTQTPLKDYVATLTKNAGFDVIFDTVGGDNFVQSFEAAKIFGKVVSIQCAGSHDLTQAYLKGLTISAVLQPLPLITGINRSHYGEILKQIATLVDRGLISPLIDKKTFNITQVGEAHHYLESGKAIGKIVIESEFPPNG